MTKYWILSNYVGNSKLFLFTLPSSDTYIFKLVEDPKLSIVASEAGLSALSCFMPYGRDNI